jgi:hypothetical protein
VKKFIVPSATLVMVALASALMLAPIDTVAAANTGPPAIMSNTPQLVLDKGSAYFDIGAASTATLLVNVTDVGFNENNAIAIGVQKGTATGIFAEKNSAIVNRTTSGDNFNFTDPDRFEAVTNRNTISEGSPDVAAYGLPVRAKPISAQNNWNGLATNYSDYAANGNADTPEWNTNGGHFPVRTGSIADMTPA